MFPKLPEQTLGVGPVARKARKKGCAESPGHILEPVAGSRLEAEAGRDSTQAGLPVSAIAARQHRMGSMASRVGSAFSARPSFSTLEPSSTPPFASNPTTHRASGCHGLPHPGDHIGRADPVSAQRSGNDRTLSSAELEVTGVTIQSAPKLPGSDCADKVASDEGAIASAISGRSASPSVETMASNRCPPPSP